MNKEQKQPVKNSNKYCFIANSCPNTQRPMYLLSSYKCCNQCNIKRCTARCCDKYEDCSLSTTKEELLRTCPDVRISEENVSLFPYQETSSTNQQKPIDKNQIKSVAHPVPPTSSGTTSTPQSDKTETEKSTVNEPTVETTLTVSQIAKMLNVSYDRVAYLIREKKLTQQQAIDRLKQKK